MCPILRRANAMFLKRDSRLEVVQEVGLVFSKGCASFETSGSVYRLPKVFFEILGGLNSYSIWRNGTTGSVCSLSERRAAVQVV